MLQALVIMLYSPLIIAKTKILFLLDGKIYSYYFRVYFFHEK